MTLYDVPAPAKVNLFLHVTGRRPDGYHTLETVFRFVGLYDTLDFDLRTDGAIVREGETLPGLSAKDDLIVRAACLLQQATGVPFGAQIRCSKVIPPGGGLGGGSSDAATTLIALNRLWQTGLTRFELMALGARLGADVPVFIFGESAFATGIGDQLTPIVLPDRAYVVVQPQQSVATQAVFQDPNLTRNEKLVTMLFFADWQKCNKPTENAGQDSRGALKFFGRNNLEHVVFANYPVVAQAHAWVQRHGVPVRMSGSGACLFAEFVTMAQASAFRDQIISKMQGCTSSNAAAVVKNAWACPGLQYHPLQCWSNE